MKCGVESGLQSAELCAERRVGERSVESLGVELGERRVESS